MIRAKGANREIGVPRLMRGARRGKPRAANQREPFEAPGQASSRTPHRARPTTGSREWGGREEGEREVADGAEAGGRG